MKRILTVKIPFEVTTTSAGKVYAQSGDKLIVQNRDAEHYRILALNGSPIFSTWKRKSWINAHCGLKMA
jgi:hypothetical protein